ncbi:DNA-deoxyinosine glycosylase [Bombiscardovia apis]|uniref:DNA-deoxyinosine glycosylase n=2 Tax=Bombiscardovia apis TaxID=2932182 RepID=A0ABM8BDG8_9BIFI|nr:DNA-deoxyinosine glycosylase [Bombiscardovia apis]
MPSPKSREVGFYFMHPRNRFWPLMAQLLKTEIGESIEERTNFLLSNHVALWDVIASCDITGAQDSTITNAVANDLKPILSQAPITSVFTSGSKATQLYRKLVLPQLNENNISLPLTSLPSTSPANAAMVLDTLCSAYSPLLLALGLRK